MSDSLKSMLIEYLQQKQQTNQSKKVDNEINMSNPQPQEEQQEQSTSNQDTEQQGQEEENTNNQNSKQDDTNTSKEHGEEPGDYQNSNYQDNNYQDNEYSNYNHSEDTYQDDEYPDEEYCENNNQDGIYKQDNYSDEEYQDDEYPNDNFEYDNDEQDGSSPIEQDNISDMNVDGDGEISTKGCLSETPTDQSDIGDLEEILNNIKDSENDEHLFDEEDYNHLLEMIKDSSSSSVLEEFLNDDSVKLEVVVDKKEANSSDANSIIKTIMEKTNNEYQVEVKFISDT